MAPDPISPYGVAKLAAERYCVSFTRVYHSFETVVLRYFNVFGPRQDPRSQYAAVVPLFITAIAAGRPVTIFDDGEQSRDFTYIDNVVAANLLAADAEGASGRIFNVSAGTPTTVNTLAENIGRLLGKEVKREYLQPRPGDLRELVGGRLGGAGGARLRALGVARGGPQANGGLPARRKGVSEDVGHAFGSIEELGEGYGFRKVRVPLGVTAFGVNAIVYPPGYEGFHHYHDVQDELYFVHAGSARVEVEGEERTLGPGGMLHVESTTPRKVSNASETEDLVMLVVGGKDGYVERDGHMVDDADVARRAAFGREQAS